MSTGAENATELSYAATNKFKEDSMIEYIAGVLMMDDKEAIHRLLRSSLTATDYADLQVSSDDDVLATFTVNRSDRIALNLELSNGKEVTLAGQLRDKTKIPVIFLAIHDLEKVAQAISELVADGSSVVADGQFQEAEAFGQLPNSHSASANHVFRVRDLTIDQARRVVRLGKETIHLTPTEYALICLLAAQAGTVLSHEQLLLSIWGVKNAHTVHLLRVNISNLRRKLERDPAKPCYLTTEPGVGYRLWGDL